MGIVVKSRLKGIRASSQFRCIYIDVLRSVEYISLFRLCIKLCVSCHLLRLPLLFLLLCLWVCDFTRKKERKKEKKGGPVMIDIVRTIWESLSKRLLWLRNLIPALWGLLLLLLSVYFVLFCFWILWFSICLVLLLLLLLGGRNKGNKIESLMHLIVIPIVFSALYVADINVEDGDSGLALLLLTARPICIQTSPYNFLLRYILSIWTTGNYLWYSLWPAIAKKKKKKSINH